MGNNIHDGRRMAKNTLYLYIRTLIVMGVSIYTSRVVLDVLDVEDYGIYNVVGGFVSMFSMLSGTLTAASQRFLAFELGKKESEIKKVFSTTITIHVLLAIALFFLLETVGLWFVNSKMNVSPDRISAANWVFQCSVITFCVNLISIPYNAAIIAYEKMAAFAYVSIFEVVAKLICTYLLYIIASDSLIIYAVFMLLVALVLRILYGVYCYRNFKECRYTFKLEKDMFRQIMSFSGWNFIGSSAAILNGQGINMLMNLFFGVTINAARGLASQVDTAINTFVQNFMMALNPQITKSFAAGDFVYVNSLIVLGTKVAVFLFWLLCLPIFINTDFVLEVWLKVVPDYAVDFVRLGMLFTLCQNLSHCLYTTMLATGRIMKYQLIVGSLSILAFPSTWLFFHLGFSPAWGYWSMIFFSLVCLLARLVLLREMVPFFSASNYAKKDLLPILTVIAPTALAAYSLHRFNGPATSRTFLVETVVCLMICVLGILYVGLSKVERNQIWNVIRKRK